MVRSTSRNFQIAPRTNDDPPWLSSKWIGVNYWTGAAAYYQNRTGMPTPPGGYHFTSMNHFRRAGIRVIRVPFYWESWERDRQAFYDDLFALLEAANANQIKVILDNHHWETGSWLGWGLGFPNSVLGVYPKRPPSFGPDYNHVRDFWGKLWDRTARDVNGVDVWRRMADFLSEVIILTNNHSAVAGYEILNEPEVWRSGDYAKIKPFNEFMIAATREHTNKPLVICWALARGGVFDTPGTQAHTFPTLVENIVFDGHAYPPSSSRMSYFQSIIAGHGFSVPLWMGEINTGFTPGSTLSRAQIFEYVQRFKDLNLHGWEFWRWSFIFDQNIPAFNLCTVVNNVITPNENFNNLADAIASIKP